MSGENWRQLYRTAILEANMERLGERVKAAEEAILYRVSLDPDIKGDELIAIRNAASALSILKRGGTKARSRSKFDIPFLDSTP